MKHDPLYTFLDKKRSSLHAYIEKEKEKENPSLIVNVLIRHLKKIDHIQEESMFTASATKNIQAMFASFLRQNALLFTKRSAMHILDIFLLSQVVTDRTTQLKMIFIDADTIREILAFCKKYNVPLEKLYQCIARIIIKGKIDFPYKHLFITNPKQRFDSLVSFDYTQRQMSVPKNPFFIRFATHQFFDLRFRKSERDTSSFMMLKFTLKDYEMEVLSDLFNEKPRIQARRYDTPISLYDQWYQWNTKFLEKLVSHAMEHGVKDVNGITSYGITPYTLRESMYAVKVKECTQFKPTLAKAFFDMFCATRVLDFSAGWGDRLIAALATKHVKKYVGFDPNIELKKGHDAIIRSFGLAQGGQYTIRYEPFEQASLDLTQTFDMVFTSPPYFDLEVYSDADTQSISSFQTSNEWVNRFLLTAVLKAWSVLEVHGHMVLHIADYRNHKYVEAMNLFIQWKCEGALFLGVVGAVGMQGSPKPLWVWKKMKNTDTSRSNTAERHLTQFFSYVSKFWK